MEKFSFKQKLEGERIYLKKHEVELAETMFNYVDKDRERLGQFLPWVDFTNTVEDELNYIKHTHNEWDEKRLFDYGIYRKSDDKYLGNCGVHTIRWEHDCCELGYWILGDFEGQGFMSEAVRTLESYLFEEGFNRVQVRCSDINSRSENVPKNNGYIYEGTSRNDSIEKGKYRSTKMFSKLSSEYIKEKDTLFIRRARKLDATGIIQSHIKSIREICSKDYNEKQIAAWSGIDFKEGIWHKSIETDHIWVLDNGEEILGFGHLKFHDENKSEIHGLYFSPDAIGKGLGHKLVSIMKLFSSSKGRNHVVLSATITAKDFYEKEGFKSECEAKSISINGEQVNCYRMEMTL